MGTAPMAIPIRSAPVHHTLGFWEFRDRLKGDLDKGRVKWNTGALLKHVTSNYGLDDSNVAAEWIERFVASTSRDVDRASRSDKATKRRGSRPPGAEDIALKSATYQPIRYDRIREAIAQEIRLGICKPTRLDIARHIVDGASIGLVEAREMADKFIHELVSELSRSGVALPQWDANQFRVPDQEAASPEVTDPPVTPSAIQP
jgi:hypothetical protein